MESWPLHLASFDEKNVLQSEERILFLACAHTILCLFGQSGERVRTVWGVGVLCTVRM